MAGPVGGGAAGRRRPWTSWQPSCARASLRLLRGFARMAHGLTAADAEVHDLAPAGRPAVHGTGT
jgi:hypothetical protein